MVIRINKDFEKEYKEDAARGFSLKELVALITGFGAMIGTGVFIYRSFGVGVQTATYLAVPAALPFLAAGFYTYQGMSPWRFFCEWREFRRTSLLCYESGEWTWEMRRTFTMKVKEEKREKKRTGIRYVVPKQGRTQKGAERDGGI